MNLLTVPHPLPSSLIQPYKEVIPGNWQEDGDSVCGGAFYRLLGGVGGVRDDDEEEKG